MADAQPLLASLLLLAVPLAPLVLAGAFVFRRLRPAGARLLPWAALPGLAAVLVVPEGTRLEVPGLLFGVVLGLDATGRLFLFLTAVLWAVAARFAARYLADDPYRWRFHGFFLLAMSGSLGINVCLDLASFFLLFALMSFISYGLVVHNRDDAAIHAGRVYMVLVVIGEVVIFTAIAILSSAGVTELPYRAFDGSDLLTVLVLIGFGIKAGALPVHVWLPLAHPVAPVPASAVLSGAMIKAGLLGWLRFLPLGTASAPDWGMFCIGAGVAATFFGVIVGLAQREPKTVLAYSSISQMGLMTIPVGIGLAVPQAWPAALSAALVLALHHGLAKGALFLGVGVAAHTSGARWPVILALLLPAAALCGLPMTSGWLAKAALKAAIGDPVAADIAWVGTLLPLTSMGTTLLMARFLVTLRGTFGSGHDDAAGLWPTWSVLLIAVAGSVWLWPFGDAAATVTMEPAQLWAATWPVVVAVGFAGFVWHLTKRLDGWRAGIPAGDLLYLFAPVIRHWRQAWSGSAMIAIGNRLGAGVRRERWASWHTSALEALATVEASLLYWPLAGAVFLTVLLMLIALVHLA